MCSTHISPEGWSRAHSSNLLNNTSPSLRCVTFCSPTDALRAHCLNKLLARKYLFRCLLLREPNHAFRKCFTYCYKHSINVSLTFFSSWYFTSEENWEDGDLSPNRDSLQSSHVSIPGGVTNWHRCFVAWNDRGKIYLNVWEKTQISNLSSLAGLDKSKR